MAALRTMTVRIDDPFVSMDASEQAMLVRRRAVSPLELVDAAIARIDKLEPKINALASSDFEAARANARKHSASGPFAGVPTLIKDLLAYPGHPLGMGTQLLKDVPAPGGSAYSDALDRSGLIVLGKSTTSEFGLLGTTETLAHGPTRNPWDGSLSPGGSSGGAVAAVASGMVPVAHASDGGGSIRGPASFCGLFGFKPSRGRTISNGLPADIPTVRWLSDHCVARSVRDSTAWLQATQRPDIDEPPLSVEALRGESRQSLRIGFYRGDWFGNPISDEANNAVGLMAAVCAELGHEVIEVTPPDPSDKIVGDEFFVLTAITIAGLFDHLRSAMGAAFSEQALERYTCSLARLATTIKGEDIERAQTALAEAEQQARDFMDSVDVLLNATVPFTAFPLGTYGPTEDPNRLQAFTKQLAGNTFVASLVGGAAMSVPSYWTPQGLPIGCHFSASQGQDRRLLALALQLEEAQPWQPRLTELAKKLLCPSD